MKKQPTYRFTATAFGKTFTRTSKNPRAFMCAAIYQAEGETLLLGFSRGYVLMGERVALLEEQTGYQAEIVRVTVEAVA